MRTILQKIDQHLSAIAGDLRTAEVCIESYRDTLAAGDLSAALQNLDQLAQLGVKLQLSANELRRDREPKSEGESESIGKARIARLSEEERSLICKAISSFGAGLDGKESGSYPLPDARTLPYFKLPFAAGCVSHALGFASAGGNVTAAEVEALQRVMSVLLSSPEGD